MTLLATAKLHDDLGRYKVAPSVENLQGRQQARRVDDLEPAKHTIRNKDTEYGFKAALAGAQCPAIGYHALRHTYASHFMMRGGSILALQEDT